MLLSSCMRIQNREIVRIPAESVEYFMPKHLLDGQILTGAGVLLAGYSKLTKGYYVSRPLNKGFHVVFSTLRGSGKVLLEDGREFFLKEGDVFFSNAYGQGTIVTKSDDENIWETCWIHILPSSTLFEPPVADCIVFHCDFLDEIRHSLVSIMEEEARRDEQALVIQELSVKLFLSYIERLLDFRQVGMDQQFRAKMHDILALFSTSMSQNWKQAKVAEKVAMSRSQLYRRCKESYHVSPGILMKRMKMENALFLLQYTKASIADIAENLGYTTQASFSYAFSRFFGTPPKNMRRIRIWKHSSSS